MGMLMSRHYMQNGVVVLAPESKASETPEPVEPEVVEPEPDKPRGRTPRKES